MMLLSSCARRTGACGDTALLLVRELQAFFMLCIRIIIEDSFYGSAGRISLSFEPHQTYHVKFRPFLGNATKTGLSLCVWNMGAPLCTLNLHNANPRRPEKNVNFSENNCELRAIPNEEKNHDG